jgi:hypothetical protein
VTAVSNGPVASNSGTGEFPTGEFSPDTQPTGDLRAGETDAFGGLVIGSIEGALAAEAVADLDQPEVVRPELDRPAHLHVAPNVERGVLYRRRRAQLLVLGVAAISAASMFMLVTFHVFAAQSAFTLDKLDTQLALEQRQYGILRDQVATLSSPAAVANRAASLGMIRAPEVTVLHPFAASAFGPTAGLPVPPPTPYSAVDNIGQ